MLKLNLKTELSFLLSRQKSTSTLVHKFYSSTKARVCYYDILGVRKDATQHDIKQAYYEKVKMFHPDQSQAPEAEEKFKIVAKAYETLKDPISRQNYDIERIRPISTYSYNGHTSYASYYSSGMQTDAVQYEYRENASEEYREGEYSATVYEKSPFSEYTSTNFLIKLCLGVGALIIFDMWWRPKKPARKVVDAEDATLAVGPLVFESPLVFVRDKPVDPVKLQEEIKQKQFRIEYIESPGKHSITAAKEKKKWKDPKPEKRIEGLDEFVASRGQKLERTKDNESL